MTAYFRTQGVVIKKEDRGEADRIFTIFTKDFGKISLRAVSVRKINSKLRSGLELFYFSEIAFVQGKIHKTITDVALIERFGHAQRDISSMRVMNRLAEIADEIIKEEEQDIKVWNLLNETLRGFNRSDMQSAERNLIAYYFLWNLLGYSGYGPSLQAIGQRDRKTAQVIESLLQGDVAILRSLSRRGIDESLLKRISQEHLLKVLKN